MNLYRKKYPIFITFILFTTYLILDDLLDGDWTKLENSYENLSVFFHESLWPPNWKVIEAQSYPECETDFDFLCSPAYIGISTTIKIAFVSTCLGFIISLPIAVISSRNLNNDLVAIPFRYLLAAMRTLPSILWALLFVITTGLGALSGVLGLTFYTVGYLGKLQYEAIEGLSSETLDAARAMGLKKTEIVQRVVIRETGNSLISQLLFMFEYNVRHGSIIGIVGAGGLGYYIPTYLKYYQYDKVMALLIILFFVVVIIDLFSMKARSYFVDDATFKSPSLFGNIFRAKK